MFSHRFPSEWADNRLSQALACERAAGREPIDLTQSNPTRAGLVYPGDLFQPLNDPRALTYTPAPCGLMEARAAVSADYARRGLSVPPERIVLTASTSEAYSLLFKVLCDPGDEVLTPRPSYPLFEHLARLDAVAVRQYDLEYHGGWSIDLAGLERHVSRRTRAVLLVNPNNPTGSFVKPVELEAISALCRDAGAAMIADEVFADYRMDAAAPRPSDVPRPPDAMWFGLGGLSKTIGLPQAKLGWIAVGGPQPGLDGALARLELACDTYLSVSTHVQYAAASLLARGAVVREQIQARVRQNYRQLLDLVRAVPSCRVLETEGGWSAVLQVPSFGSEEDLVVDLLRTKGVLVHPGFFFDFPRESYLVVSLLPPLAAFREGLSRIFEHLESVDPGVRG